MEIHLSNGDIRKYGYEDILVVERYPGLHHDETAVIFTDHSVLWEGAG